jgi:DnaJ-like protein
MRDDLQRAYATLGLSSGASPAEIKRRYRLLVKTWHPDRFASDPEGQAAASDRLTHINNAYRLLLGNRAMGARADPPRTRETQSARPSRLSREQIDAMVNAIGNDGPVDWLMGGSAQRAGPSGAAGLSDARPASIALGIVFLLTVAAIDLVSGPWVYPLLLWLVIVAAAASWFRGRLTGGWNRGRSGRQRRPIRDGHAGGPGHRP